MKRNCLFAVVLVCCVSSPVGADWSDYSPSTPGEAWSRAATGDNPDEYTIETASVKWTVEGTSTGKSRSLPTTRKVLFGRWAKALGHPAHYAELCKSEVQIETAGKTYWLPIQDELLEAFRAQAGSGVPVRLYIMYVGAVGDDPMFIINRFDVTVEEREELEKWARSLDRGTVHKAVLDHERDPLGKDSAEKIRPVLLVHFEPLDYIVCLDQIGSLMGSEDELPDAVFWQVVFGSGDYFEEHPEEADDKFTYMLAGLESGLRAYENVLAQEPERKVAFLDGLIDLRDEGRLMEFVRDHPCDDE